jgi:polygalacturonase
MTKNRLRLLGIFAISPILLLPVGSYGQKICDAKAFGAKGDGTTKDTASLQKAIDTCSAAGGGIVRLTGSPEFVSAPLTLKSNITLEISAATTLAASQDHEDFPEMDEFHSAAANRFLGRITRRTSP